MNLLISTFLLALQGLSPEYVATSNSSSTGTYLALAAIAGTAVATRKAWRKAMRKNAWQQLWHRRRKLSIESPEFLWVAIILGAVGLLAALFGLGLLAGVTLGAAVLCLIRSFF